MASSLALAGCGGPGETEAPTSGDSQAAQVQQLDTASPDQGAANERRLIVYQTTSLSLYAVDTQGSLRLLAKRSGAPVTSPDGRSVAYSKLPDSYQPGEPVTHADLHVYNLQSGHTQQVTRGYDDTEPVWTPDGRNLLFQSTRRSGRPALWKVRSNGTGLDQVTNQETLESAGDIIPNPATGGTVQWSPDNQRRLIVYSTTTLTNGEVRVIDFGQMFDVENTYSLGEGHSPHWTENGTVVFARNEGDKVIYIEVGVD
ncbi:TolB family protein [Pyxidicoccus fallax]|nr:hypothetical protein [Pyxidicoccus fallax]